MLRINVSIGLSSVVVTARFVPESRADHRLRVDPIGQLPMIVLLRTTLQNFEIVPVDDTSVLTEIGGARSGTSADLIRGTTASCPSPRTS